MTFTFHYSDSQPTQLSTAPLEGQDPSTEYDDPLVAFLFSIYYNSLLINGEMK